MTRISHKDVLLVAGLGTLGLAAAQALMPFSRALVRAFDGPADWSTPLLVATSLIVCAVFAYMGAAALSLADVLPPLPLRRVMVVLAAAGFIIRGFPLVPQLLAETSMFDPADAAASGAQLLASAVSLGLGVLYFVGLTDRAALSPVHD